MVSHIQSLYKWFFICYIIDAVGVSNWALRPFWWVCGCVQDKKRIAGPDILADIHGQVETVFKWKVIRDFRHSKWQQLSLWARKVKNKNKYSMNSCCGIEKYQVSLHNSAASALHNWAVLIAREQNEWLQKSDSHADNQGQFKSFSPPPIHCIFLVTGKVVVLLALISSPHHAAIDLCGALHRAKQRLLLHNLSPSHTYTHLENTSVGLAAHFYNSVPAISIAHNELYTADD